MRTSPLSTAGSFVRHGVSLAVEPVLTAAREGTNDEREGTGKRSRCAQRVAGRRRASIAKMAHRSATAIGVIKRRATRGEMRRLYQTAATAAAASTSSQNRSGAAAPGSPVSPV
jgi:hypothetical protein